MARTLRWCLAYFGTIFLMSLAVFLLFWVLDGFVGEVWAILMAPFVFTPLVGMILLVPALLIDRLLVAAAMESIPVYAIAGGALAVLAILAWGLLDGRGVGTDLLRDEMRGLLIIGGLGVVGGALFRAIKGARP